MDKKLLSTLLLLCTLSTVYSAQEHTPKRCWSVKRWLTIGFIASAITAITLCPTADAPVIALEQSQFTPIGVNPFAILPETPWDVLDCDPESFVAVTPYEKFFAAIHRYPNIIQEIAKHPEIQRDFCAELAKDDRSLEGTEHLATHLSPSFDCLGTTCTEKTTLWETDEHGGEWVSFNVICTEESEEDENN